MNCCDVHLKLTQYYKSAILHLKKWLGMVFIYTHTHTHIYTVQDILVAYFIYNNCTSESPHPPLSFLVTMSYSLYVWVLSLFHIAWDPPGPPMLLHLAKCLFYGWELFQCNTNLILPLALLDLRPSDFDWIIPLTFLGLQLAGGR